jgi:hypothetical protein
VEKAKAMCLGRLPAFGPHGRQLAAGTDRKRPPVRFGYAFPTVNHSIISLSPCPCTRKKEGERSKFKAAMELMPISSPTKQGAGISSPGLSRDGRREVLVFLGSGWQLGSHCVSPSLLRVDGRCT